MSREMMVALWSDTSLVAALGQVQSAWFDIGKQTPITEVTRSNTGGTYVFEVDWSRDGGSTTMTTDTPATVTGERLSITGKARWVRFRVRNTHATNAFTAHSTVVLKDVGTTS